MSGRGSGGSGRENIRRLQQVETELIRLFADICEKEHLRYYMLCGTMLGAVRHKGFIPWDDDADFGMPRPDYERFLKIAHHYLMDGAHLETFDGETNVYYWTKLATPKMKVLFYDLKEPQSHDAYIDVFPLDGMPEGFLQNHIRQAKILFYRKLYALAIFDRGVGLHSTNRTWYAKIGTAICRVIPVQRLLSAQKRWDGMDRLLKKCGYDESPLLVDAMGGYKFKEMFLKEVFGDGALYEFEGMRLRGPQDYETYLTQLYGDYMTPPPESQRNWHNTEILEIEEERE